MHSEPTNYCSWCERYRPAQKKPCSKAASAAEKLRLITQNRPHDPDADDICVFWLRKKNISMLGV